MKIKIAAVLLLALVACSKSNDPTPSFNLAGHWIITSSIVNGSVDILPLDKYDRFAVDKTKSNHFMVKDTIQFTSINGGYTYTKSLQKGNSIAGLGVAGWNFNQSSSGGFSIIEGTVSSDYRKITATKVHYSVTCATSPPCGITEYNSDVDITLVMTRTN